MNKTLAPGSNEKRYKSVSDVTVKRIDPETGEIIVVGTQPAYDRDEMTNITGLSARQRNRRNCTM